jgi:hypothetical protein
MHPSCLSFKLMINTFSTRRDVYWISLEHPTIKESCSSSFWLLCYIDISRTKGFRLCFWYVGKVLMSGGVMRSFIILKLSMQEWLNVPIMEKNIVDIHPNINAYSWNSMDFDATIKELSRISNLSWIFCCKSLWEFL